MERSGFGDPWSFVAFFLYVEYFWHLLQDADCPWDESRASGDSSTSQTPRPVHRCIVSVLLLFPPFAWAVSFFPAKVCVHMWNLGLWFWHLCSLPANLLSSRYCSHSLGLDKIRSFLHLMKANKMWFCWIASDEHLTLKFGGPFSFDSIAANFLNKNSMWILDISLTHNGCRCQIYVAMMLQFVATWEITESIWFLWFPWDLKDAATPWVLLFASRSIGQSRNLSF